MSLTDKHIGLIVSRIQQIYEHIILSEIPDDVPYLAYLTSEKPYALGNAGYYECYQGLLHDIYALPIAEAWSEEGIQEQIHYLLDELAETKARPYSSPKFHKITMDWLKKLEAPFPESECYMPIIGLGIDEPLSIGKITFWPLETKKKELSGRAYLSLFEGLSASLDCLAYSRIQAEPRRAIALLMERSEYALNILRFLGSLVWHSQPTRHIYIGGQQRSRLMRALSIDPTGLVTHINNSTYTPLPFKLDSHMSHVFEFYGLSYLQTLVQRGAMSPIEGSLLTAIQWYGDATQELSSLLAFIKFYISIETLTKKDREHAKVVLPKRLSVLIDDWDKNKQAEVKKVIELIIDERNAVLHSGQPSRSSADYLARTSQNVARSAIH